MTEDLRYCAQAFSSADLVLALAADVYEYRMHET